MTIVDNRCCGRRVVPLRGHDNFYTWKIQIKALSKGLGLWKYVSGVEPKPREIPSETDSAPLNLDAIAAWEAGDARALMEIILSLATSLLMDVEEAETSKAVFDILCDLHESGRITRRLIWHNKFWRTRYVEGSDLEEHVNKFIEIRRRMVDMGLPAKDDQFAMALLISLPQSWEERLRPLLEGARSLPSEAIISYLLFCDSQEKEKKDFQCS